MKKILSIFALALIFSASVNAAEKQEEEFERGVGKMNSVFIPKGYIGGGLNFSYNTLELGNVLESIKVFKTSEAGKVEAGIISITRDSANNTILKSLTAFEGCVVCI